tara:strand:- start:1517 stop:1999 length:483 start_codon:yes stop_codon:yes gene_type:complete
MLKKDIEKIVKPVINDNNCFIWGIEILRGKKNTTLRIFIDSDNGVDINDCENISKDLKYEPNLDLSLGDNYILEVSTPGIDRKFFEINQLNDYIGEDLLLKSKELHNGKRNFSGKLSKCKENMFSIVVENKVMNFNFNDIDLCKLKPNYKKLIKDNNYAK